MFLRGTYLLATVSLLVASLVLLNQVPPLEGPAQLFLYGMMVLTFPIGLGIIYLWGSAAMVVQSALPDSMVGTILGAGTPTGMAILWLLLVIAGYFQWFIVGPAAVKWLRARYKGQPELPTGASRKWSNNRPPTYLGMQPRSIARLTTRSSGPSPLRGVVR
jgi:hypothetical protein